MKQSKSMRYLGTAIVFFVAFLLMFAVSTFTANAVQGSDDSTTSSQEQEKEAEDESEDLYKQKREDLEEKLKQKREKLEQEKKERQEARLHALEDRKEERSTKLEEAKLKVCEKRQDSINRRMDNISERATKHLEVFNKISERTQAFYKDKGLSLETYDVLVDDVDAKKSAAESAIDTLKETDVDFTCDSEDPLGITESFIGAREEVRIAMKEYKTSIKNLIAGVKSVASTETEGEE